MRISLLDGVSVLGRVLNEKKAEEERKASEISREEEKARLINAHKEFAVNLVEELNSRKDSCGRFKLSYSNYLFQKASLHCSSVSDYLPQEYSVDIDSPKKTITFSPIVTSFEIDFQAETDLSKLLALAEDYANTAKDLQEVDDFLREYSCCQVFSYISPFFYSTPGQLWLPGMEPPERPVQEPRETTKLPPDHDYFSYLKKVDENDLIKKLENAPTFQLILSPLLKQGKLFLRGDVTKEYLSGLSEFLDKITYAITLDYFSKRASLEVSPAEFEADISKQSVELIEGLKEDLELVMGSTKALDKLLSEHAVENKFTYQSLFPEENSEKK